MNKYQQGHLDGTIDVYAHVEAYTEKWEHITDKYGRFLLARPVPNTRNRQDMPSLAEQWKGDWKRRCETRRIFNVKGISNR